MPVFSKCQQNSSSNAKTVLKVFTDLKLTVWQIVQEIMLTLKMEVNLIVNIAIFLYFWFLTEILMNVSVLNNTIWTHKLSNAKCVIIVVWLVRITQFV